MNLQVGTLNLRTLPEDVQMTLEESMRQQL